MPFTSATEQAAIADPRGVPGSVDPGLRPPTRPTARRTGQPAPVTVIPHEHAPIVAEALESWEAQTAAGVKATEAVATWTQRAQEKLREGKLREAADWQARAETLERMRGPLAPNIAQGVFAQAHQALREEAASALQQIENMRPTQRDVPVLSASGRYLRQTYAQRQWLPPALQVGLNLNGDEQAAADAIQQMNLRADQIRAQVNSVQSLAKLPDAVRTVDEILSRCDAILADVEKVWRLIRKAARTKAAGGMNPKLVQEAGWRWVDEDGYSGHWTRDPQNDRWAEPAADYVSEEAPAYDHEEALAEGPERAYEA